MSGYVHELEALVARLHAQAFGVAVTDVVVTPHGSRPGIVVRAPGRDAFYVDLDAFLRTVAIVAHRKLVGISPEPDRSFARLAELEACITEALTLLEPREAAETLPAPPGAEEAA